MRNLRTLYLLIILLLTVGIMAFVTMYDTSDEYEIYYVDDLNGGHVINLYCLNENKEITSTKVEVEDISYGEIFKLYNEKMNSLSVGYFSPLSSYIDDYEINFSSDTLNIKVNKLLGDEIDLLLECLSLTFKEFGVKKINLTCGKAFYTKNM